MRVLVVLDWVSALHDLYAPPALEWLPALLLAGALVGWRPARPPPGRASRLTPRGRGRAARKAAERRDCALAARRAASPCARGRASSRARRGAARAGPPREGLPTSTQPGRGRRRGAARGPPGGAGAQAGGRRRGAAVHLGVRPRGYLRICWDMIGYERIC